MRRTARPLTATRSRQDSVRLGVTALSEHSAGILVHDGARPLVRAHDIRAGMRVVRPGCASLLAKRRQLRPPAICAASTPMRYDLSWPPVTDDAALLERGGVSVHVRTGIRG